MELNRQLRFLIPPVVFFISIFWSVIFDLYDFFPKLSKQISPGILGVMVAFVLAGTFVVALGFIISSISVWMVFGRRWFGAEYEAPVSDRALNRMTQQLGVVHHGRKLYPVATWHHWLLKRQAPGLSEWLSRRWNMALVSLNCFVALCISFLIGVGFQVCHLCKHLTLAFELFQWTVFFWWWLPHVFLLFVFLRNCRNAREEVEEMFDFLI